MTQSPVEYDGRHRVATDCSLQILPPRVKVNQFRNDLTDTVKPVVLALTEFALVFKAHEADINHTAIAETGDNDGFINGARTGIVVLVVTTVFEITCDQA